MAASSPLDSSQLFGNIVVIRRSGEDGSTFPMTTLSCVIGKSDECSIRVQLPSVSAKQCEVGVTSDDRAVLTNLCGSNPTVLNSRALAVGRPVALNHRDLIGIADRYFRFEYPEGHPMACEGSAAPAVKPKATRKSRSPKTPKSLDSPSDRKVLTPTRKPPTPLFHEDSENLGPDDASPHPSALRRRRSSAASYYINEAMTKVLTPKAKPPLPPLVTNKEVSGAPPRSPAPPGRRSGDLRRSLSEIKQKSISISEEVEPEQPSSEPRSNGRKRKSTPEQSAVACKKRVSFGSYLSPELFDKALPPVTPVRKGRIPKHLDSDAAAPASPGRGLLKRRSVAVVPSTSSISEESPGRRRSPRISEPLPPVDSSSTKVSKVHQVTQAHGANASRDESASRRQRHVVVKSPHVPHHEMSDAEQQLYAEQRKQEGEVFKHKPHSPVATLSPPATPPALKLVSASASPTLSGKKSKASPAATARSGRSSSTPGSSAKRQTTPASRNASPRSVSGPPLNQNETPPKTRPARSVFTPGRHTVVHTDTPRPKTPKSSSRNNSMHELEKIAAPPIDLAKAVALRAIHGKAATPKLAAKTPTPKKSQTKRVSSTRKSGAKQPTRKTWADIVKTSRRKSATTVKQPSTRTKLAPNPRQGKKAVTKVTARPITKRKSAGISRSPAAATPKGFASSTGHVDSPETIVIRKGRLARNKTPGKAADQVLYEELPPTPIAPPAVMFVSPLAVEPSKRRSVLTKMADKECSSPSLVGVKEMMRSRKSTPEANLVGVKEMMREPRKSGASPRLVGVKDMMREPRKSTASPRLAGVKEMMRASKKPAPSPRLTGVREMMREPKQSISPSLVGVREMLGQTNEAAASPSLVGVRELMREPRRQTTRSPRLAGIKEMMRSPGHSVGNVDLTGVEELFTTAEEPLDVHHDDKVDIPRASTKAPRGSKRKVKVDSPVVQESKRKRTSLETEEAPMVTRRATRSRTTKATTASPPAPSTRKRAVKATEKSTKASASSKSTRTRAARKPIKPTSPIQEAAVVEDKQAPEAVTEVPDVSDTPEKPKARTTRRTRKTGAASAATDMPTAVKAAAKTRSTRRLRGGSASQDVEHEVVVPEPPPTPKNQESVTKVTRTRSTRSKVTASLDVNEVVAEVSSTQTRATRRERKTPPEPTTLDQSEPAAKPLDNGSTNTTRSVRGRRRNAAAIVTTDDQSTVAKQSRMQPRSKLTRKATDKADSPPATTRALRSRKVKAL